MSTWSFVLPNSTTPPRGPVLRTMLTAVGLSVGLLGGLASAGTEQPTGTGTLDALLAALDADDFATRETASSRLESNELISLADIEDRLMRVGLTAEQRTRLDSAARRRFAAQPRAGLGVQFGAPRREEGIELGAVLPNFPASEVLLAGDVVIAIDGVRVSDTAQMGSFILSHRPGETLRMLIDRSVPARDQAFPAPDQADGPAAGLEAPVAMPTRVERLTLDVPLGRYDDLNTGAQLTPDRIESAYRRYQFRNGLLSAGTSTTGNGPAGAGLTPLGWLRAEGYDHTIPTAPAGSFEALSAWRHVGFAGQPRSWAALIDLRRGDPNAMARRVTRGLQADGIYDRIEEALAGYRAILERVVEIDKQLTPTGSSPVPDPARVMRIQAERDELAAGLEELAAEMAESVEPASSAVEIDPLP